MCRRKTGTLLLGQIQPEICKYGLYKSGTVRPFCKTCPAPYIWVRLDILHGKIRDLLTNARCRRRPRSPVPPCNGALLFPVLQSPPAPPYTVPLFPAPGYMVLPFMAPPCTVPPWCRRFRCLWRFRFRCLRVRCARSPVLLSIQSHPLQVLRSTPFHPESSG